MSKINSVANLHVQVDVTKVLDFMIEGYWKAHDDNDNHARYMLNENAVPGLLNNAVLNGFNRDVEYIKLFDENGNTASGDCKKGSFIIAID